MEELAAGDQLPGRIYLCGGGSHLPEIRDALADQRFTKALPFSRPPEVTIMAPEQVEMIADTTKLLVDQQDVTPMGLAYQAIELGAGAGSLDGALRRVVKQMRI
jgi:cell division protein FtsA